MLVQGCGPISGRAGLLCPTCRAGAVPVVPVTQRATTPASVIWGGSSRRTGAAGRLLAVTAVYQTDDCVPLLSTPHVPTLGRCSLAAGRSVLIRWTSQRFITTPPQCLPTTTRDGWVLGIYRAELFASAPSGLDSWRETNGATRAKTTRLHISVAGCVKAMYSPQP